MVLGRFLNTGSPSEPTAAHRPDEGGPRTIPEMVNENRHAYGDKIAFQQKARGQWRRASFTQAYEQSRALAAGLLGCGLEPGARVALVAENGIDWVCAYYAIVTAGGIAVPIYYDLKPTEIADMLERAEARIIFASAKVLAKLEAVSADLHTAIVIGGGAQPHEAVPGGLLRHAKAEVLAIEDLPARATAASRDRLAAVIVEPDDLASIVFTSGTTGGMKGVMLTHRNFIANTRSMTKAIPFSPSDRVVMVLPMHHAFPFLVGATVAPSVGAELTFENDLRRIRDRMAEVKPTLFMGVPQLFEVMYRNIVHGIEAQGKLETFEKALRIVEATKQRTGINIGRIVFREVHKKLGGHLRFMFSGGAALNPQVALSFARLGIPIIQGWGLTESSPGLTAQRWNPRKFYTSNYYEEHFGTVGTAVPGVEIGLIDVPEKELYVHLHGEGELVARGENISPGYWQSEEATKAAKVGEWLRTGDVGYIDDEGNVWITGRSKFVIVLDSGEKIHPDELEEKLVRSAVIEDVAIIGRKIRGKAQAWAVIYPNRDEVLARLGGEPATEESVRRIVKAEIDAAEADVATFKRTTDFMLTDLPLPRTQPLKKIARGQIADSYSFDPRHWEQSWADYVAAAAPPADDEAEEPAALATV